MPQESAEPDDQDEMPDDELDRQLRRRRPDDEHKQLLFFSWRSDQENYAIVRTTWYEGKTQ